MGSFPSVKSRESNFYYAHPQNRFWKVLASLFQEEIPESMVKKKELLLRNKIALWDVISSCDIIGSSDSSIKNVKPTDLNSMIKHSQIKRIYTNGKLAGRLYQKFQFEHTQIETCELPSTSPANAAFSIERLVKEWKIIL